MSHPIFLIAFKNMFGLFNHYLGYVGTSWCLETHLEDGLRCVSFIQNHVFTELIAQIDEFRANYPNMG